MGGRLRTRLAQGGRLGAAARLGDGLGVGREQDREPQPDGDLDLEAEARRPLTGCKPVALATAIMVTRTAVISTTNMTGFLMSSRGSSFRKACGRRRPEEVGIEDAARARRPAGRLRAAERDEALEAARPAAGVE